MTATTATPSRHYYNEHHKAAEQHGDQEILGKETWIDGAGSMRQN